jgi:hypothetical protein
MHQYSRKLSGSQRERRKFLRRNRRKRPDEMEPQDEEENLDERFINGVDDEEVVCMDKIPNQFVDKEQVTQLRQRFEKINKTVMKPLQEEKESNHHRKAQ